MTKKQNLNIKQVIALYPEIVKNAIEKAGSQSEILTILGLSPTNTRARQLIQSFAASSNIQLPRYNASFKATNLLTREEILSRLIKSDKTYGTVLRKWILKFNLIPYECATQNCIMKKPVWNGSPLTFDLDHINGDNTDNRLENLRFLCPNCHSQTETYKGKNIKPRKDGIVELCEICNEVSRTGKYCRKHSKHVDNSSLSAEERIQAFKQLPPWQDLVKEKENYSLYTLSQKYGISQNGLKSYLKNPNFEYKEKPQTNLTAKTTYPETDVLLRRVQSEGYEALARELGVSGNAIRKRLQRLTGSYPKTRARLRKSA
jgi:Zn finger protein HypA/HybF involved in hydrogenase expression